MVWRNTSSLPALIFAGAVAATSSISPAHSTETPSSRPSVDANAYEEGKSLYRKGKFEAARTAFERALQTSNDPRLLWNLAACENKLLRFADAYRWVERYLESAPRLPVKEREEAIRFREALRARIVRVSFDVAPSDTLIEIDEKEIGRSPLSSAYYLDAGPHSIRFSKPGFLAVTRQEELTPGDSLSFAIVLESAPPPRPSASSRPAPRESNNAKMSASVVGVAGIAAAATGAALMLIASERYDTFQTSCAPSCSRSEWEGSAQMETAGVVSLAVGGVLAIAGTVLYLAQRTGSKGTKASAAASGFQWLGTRTAF